MPIAFKLQMIYMKTSISQGHFSIYLLHGKKYLVELIGILMIGKWRSKILIKIKILVEVTHIFWIFLIKFIEILVDLTKNLVDLIYQNFGSFIFHQNSS